MKIVLATHNKDKQVEIMNALSKFNINVLSLDSFPKIGEIIEDGVTLKENAFIKAKTVNQITGIPTIADDTGLEVDALDGAPGVYSARFAGENCSYQDNVHKILEKMDGVPYKKRLALFKTCMVYIDNKLELTAEGTVEGYITTEPKGLGGFGYDPVFYVQEQGKTFAEMTIKEKNIISHRGKAIKNLCSLMVSKVNLTKIQENA